ncbi:MAG: phosphatase PAP2 family protein [Bacteroidetes bacterium]|nr:phosphatase PAP2 family protein [Bacteroidota bacterium]
MNILQHAWEFINTWDRYLFLKINSSWTNPFFDAILPWWRDSNTWTPLYLFLILFVVINSKKQAFFWILAAIITLVLTDQISSSLVKPLFGRLRPCSDPSLINQVRLLLPNCSGGYSFTSSHATNHFGFASFVFITLKPLIKKWGNLLFLWAATISFSQVYVGVHYPLDILSGAILGLLIGYTTAYFFNLWQGPMKADPINTIV